jgi:hypothetical protein
VLFLACAAILPAFVTLDAEAATKYETAMARWNRTAEFTDDLGSRFMIKATLYTSDYIENLMENEAEKNLWTASELEDYKYNFLKGLKLDDYIAIYLELEELGATAHMAPFDEMVHIWIGNKKYAPAEYDQRFNFPLQGKRDGIVYFPRYDEKTGESLFKKDVTIRFIMVAGASPVLGSREARLNWDVKADNIGVPSSGTAADRIEVDRLLRRLERLASEKAELESQLEAKNTEINEINARIEELQRR